MTSAGTLVHVDLSYKRPALLGDIIEVTTEVTDTKNASLAVRNQVLKDNLLLAEAHVTIACIDKDGKPKRLPEIFKT